MKWVKCCKNQCSRSWAVSGWVWTPFCVILWGWLTKKSSSPGQAGVWFFFCPTLDSLTRKDCASQTCHSFHVTLAGLLQSTKTKSWFSGRGWGQQLFSFQSPAVQWMARTSSLNCLSCRNPYQTPDSLNCLPPFHWKALFSLKSASSHPHPKNRLWSWRPSARYPPYRAIPFRDSIAEGGIAPICLVLIGYRASIAEIPLLRRGYRPSTSHALQGGNNQKRGRGYRTQLAMLRHRIPFLKIGSEKPPKARKHPSGASRGPLRILREAEPGGFQTGGFPTLFGKGPDCVADPLGTVPRRCCS